VLNQTSFQVYNASAGSGKTFTLVKEYLKILFLADTSYQFQNILAVTFTNMAAAEMKERVVENLTRISLGIEDDMHDLLVNETGIDKKIIREKAKQILNILLQNYSAFNIYTIDTFTHKLIRAFAIDLGLSVNFEVEMDTDPWLQEAVRQVISKVGTDKQITKLLTEYALMQIDDDKGWDITRDLIKISKILLNEEDAVQLQKLQSKSIPEFISFRKDLYQRKKSIEEEFRLIGEEALEIIDNKGVEYNSFFRSMFPNHFKNLAYDLKKAKFFDQNTLKKRVEEQTLVAVSKPEKIKQEINEILPELILLYERSEALFEKYQLILSVLKSITPLAVLSELNKSLTSIKEENNIKFHAEFNRIINNYLIDQPAAFIYERIGEKFKYYYIDEMQDTSVLQWNNLIPLISNALSQEQAGLLLVGDAKQSIYRWRGGKPEQFICLSSEEVIESSCTRENFNPFYIPKEVKNLDTNYRSFSEVIGFNNSFFTSVSKFLIKESHKILYRSGNDQKITSKKGGYVQIDFIAEEKLNNEKRAEIIPEEVYQIILSLEGEINRNEIAILVSKHDQGIEIANYLSLKGIAIESSETLLLKSNPKVDFIINLLQYIALPDDKNSKFNFLYFLHEHLKIDTDKHSFIAEYIDKDPASTFKELEKYQVDFNPDIFVFTPLYENIEQIIRGFRLNETADAYLLFFLEEILSFTQHHSQSIQEFLEYWELKKNKLSIASSNNKESVKISTIHKAKGLEYRVVIFPYEIKLYDVKNDARSWYDLSNFEENHGFEQFYIPATSSIKYTGTQGQEIFQRNLENIELDNLNKLYVAFTRAVEQLYIIAEKGSDKSIKNSGEFLKNYLLELGLWQKDKEIYEFGDKTFVRKEKKEEVKEPLLMEDLISSPWQDHHITIAATSELLWDPERKKAVDFGNVIHKIMENVIVKEDLDILVERFVNNGVITYDEAVVIKERLQKLLEHPDLEMYFRKGNKVFTEREILDEQKKILIPDRLNFLEDKQVVIIDYKTGSPEKRHYDQLEKYAEVLQKMNFKINKKILIYIDKDISIVNV